MLNQLSSPKAGSFWEDYQAEALHWPGETPNSSTSSLHPAGGNGPEADQWTSSCLLDNYSFHMPVPVVTETQRLPETHLTH